MLKIEHKPTSRLMAAKCLIIPITEHRNPENEERVKRFMNELEIYPLLWECPEIIGGYGYAIHEGRVMICMELMDMSLKKLYIDIHDQGRRVPEILVWYSYVKIINALVFCKEKRIMHRDIKPTNVLMNRT